MKLPLAQDWRRHTPVPRETKQWRRLYRRRTAVERVFSRLKGQLLLGTLRVRGLLKVRVRLTLSLVILLAAALGMAQQQRWPATSTAWLPDPRLRPRRTPRAEPTRLPPRAAR